MWQTRRYKLYPWYWTVLVNIIINLTYLPRPWGLGSCRLSLNQATLGWGLPPLERQVTLIMSPWLIDPDMSPRICGSPGGSKSNLSKASLFLSLAAASSRWPDKTGHSIGQTSHFSQWNEISQLWSRSEPWAACLTLTEISRRKGIWQLNNTNNRQAIKVSMTWMHCIFHFIGGGFKRKMGENLVNCFKGILWYLKVVGQRLTVDSESDPLLHGVCPPECSVLHHTPDGPAVVLGTGAELEGVGGVPGLLPVPLVPVWDLVWVLWK